MDKKTIVALLTLLSSAIVLFQMKPESKLPSAFDKFKTEFGKNYVDEDEAGYREIVFLRNLEKIETHNADKTQSYKLGVNQFSDLTQEEFTAIYLHTQPKHLKPRTIRSDLTVTKKHSHAPVKADIDWTTKGKVSPVKDQGQCGSCWAFSATGSMESAWLLEDATVLLSEQQLVDCSGSYGNQGCNGGWMDYAFDFVIDHGITTEDQYPYKAVDQNCKATSGPNKISSYVDIQGCDDLMSALQDRPIAVAVAANAWQSYQSGILSNCDSSINHGVLLVGSTSTYLKLKNSWSEGWGENGFIRIKPGNTCEVCSYPSYPVI